MPVLDQTPLGLPLPHPDNDPYAIDVPRLRAALTLIDSLLGEMQGTVDAVPGAVEAALAAFVEGAPEAMNSFVETANRILSGEEAATALANLVGSKASQAAVDAAFATINVALGGKADGTATNTRFDAVEASIPRRAYALNLHLGS